MEVLSAFLQPYKGLVGSTASIVTIAQFFAGALICKDIHKNKSTAGVSAMPFIGGLVIGILMIKYSLLLQDEAMMVVNVSAVILNLLYILFYYAHSEDKNGEVHKPLSYGSLLIAILLGYVSWEDQELIEYRYGFVVTILMLLLMGSPLVELKGIIEKKDASSIPFPIVSSAFAVTFLWLLYGIILLNHFIIVQNVLGLILCGAQLLLCWMYPQKVTRAKKE